MGQQDILLLPDHIMCNTEILICLITKLLLLLKCVLQTTSLWDEESVGEKLFQVGGLNLYCTLINREYQHAQLVKSNAR